MITFAVAHTYNNLLQESQWLVYIGSLFETDPLSPRFLDSLTASKVDKVQLRIDNFLRRLSAGSALHIDSVNAVRARGLFVEGMCWYSAIGFTFEQVVQGFLLVLADALAQAFYVNLTFGIVLDGYGIALLLVSWYRWNEVEHELIVDL